VFDLFSIFISSSCVFTHSYKNVALYSSYFLLCLILFVFNMNKKQSENNRTFYNYKWKHHLELFYKKQKIKRIPLIRSSKTNMKTGLLIISRLSSTIRIHLQILKGISLAHSRNTFAVPEPLRPPLYALPPSAILLHPFAPPDKKTQHNFYCWKYIEKLKK